MVEITDSSSPATTSTTDAPVPSPDISKDKDNKSNVVEADDKGSNENVKEENLGKIFSSAAATSSSEETNFVNASSTGEIPSFNGDEKAKATDFANYFCSYAQLYHQKQMLADHNRMAAYHAAILGNKDVFEGKVVMDVGTGSGILAVWAAQAGARKVYAIEYTDMAKHAKSVMKANGVEDIVTVIQGAVEDIELPLEKDQLVAEEDDDGNGTNDDGEKKNTKVVDIIISEWMGYFLLRESMLDSIIRARDKFLKKRSGLMMPSHCSMYVAPITDEEERKTGSNEYASAMSDWFNFCETTKHVYGVDMSILESEFDREQKEYYLLSSRWTELSMDCMLCEPKVIKQFNLNTCTIEDSRGISLADGDKDATFDFYVNGNEYTGPISGIAGWFTADFKSRTDSIAVKSIKKDDDDVDKDKKNEDVVFIKSCAPIIKNPSFLSTGPENGYTHWGQQSFYFLSSIPLLKGQMTRLTGSIEMMRTKENSRLYNCRIRYNTSRLQMNNNTNDEDDKNGKAVVLMKSGTVEQVYQIP